jgi:hypothetical protein
MFDFAEVRDLERRLQNRKVLSVFVDTRETADGPSWRRKLDRALARLEATGPCPSSGDRTARELCMGHLRTTLEGIREAPEAPGWIAYVTTDDVVAGYPVDTRVETAVFWQTGIVTAPVLDATAKRPQTQPAASPARVAVQRLAGTRPPMRIHAPLA